MAIGIVITVEDAKKQKSNTTIWIPSGTTYDDAMEFAAALAQLWANMSDGQVVKVGVTFAVDVSGLASNTMGANADVEEGARFVWDVDGGYKASNRIATFLESKLIAGTNRVDLTDPDVAQWVGYMESGFTATSTNVVNPCDYRSDDIEDLASALESFTRSRKLI